jgi:RHS repeat-associated protein
MEYLAGAANGSTSHLVGQYTNENGNGVVLQQYEYTYDANGNILTISDGGVLKASYTYDGLNRLIREDNAWTNVSYSYNFDAGGNLNTVTTHAYTTGALGAATATQNYSYNVNGNWKDQLTALGGVPITYDALGNPTDYSGFTFTWARGRLLTRFAGPGLAIDYAYDADGRRIRQTVNNSAVTNFTYSGDLLMRQSDGTNTLDFQYDANGTAVGFNYNGTPYYYLRNLQGDVVAITNKTGTIVGEYTYDAWGNTALWGSVAAVNPIRYRGYYEDSVTGWYWLQTRWYIPQWRRFVNADAMFVAGDDAINASNMYAYCNGNPVMNVDPSGMAPQWWNNLVNGVKKAAQWVVDLPKTISAAINNGLNSFGQMVSGKIGEFIGPILQRNLPWAADLVEFGANVFNFLTLGGLKAWTDRVAPSWLPKLRDFFPKRLMQLFGAWPGAVILDFHYCWDPFSPNFRNYTTLEGSYQWQKAVGYTWFYDWFFDAGGPIKKLIYDFHNDDNDMSYAVWCWKADYWNLGAGAEIGMYYQDDPARAAKGYFEIDPPDLKFKLHMKINYRGQQMANLKQTNWWVTAFAPRHQKPNIDNIVVWQAVSIYSAAYNKNGTRYVDGNGSYYINTPARHSYNLDPDPLAPGKSKLFTYLHQDWDQRATNNVDFGKHLKWTPTPGAGWDYVDNNYADYEFYIKF